jgi:hypothetical protein
MFLVITGVIVGIIVILCAIASKVGHDKHANDAHCPGCGTASGFHDPECQFVPRINWNEVPEIECPKCGDWAIGPPTNCSKCGACRQSKKGRLSQEDLALGWLRSPLGHETVCELKGCDTAIYYDPEDGPERMCSKHLGEEWERMMKDPVFAAEQRRLDYQIPGYFEPDQVEIERARKWIDEVAVKNHNDAVDFLRFLLDRREDASGTN